MKQTHAPEDFNDLAADLAMTIADVLDHPDCPSGLADALHEITDELTNAIGPSISEQLRALAALAKARGGETRAEGETPAVGRLNAKAAAFNSASLNSLS